LVARTDTNYDRGPVPAQPTDEFDRGTFFDPTSWKEGDPAMARAQFRRSWALPGESGERPPLHSDVRYQVDDQSCPGDCR